MRALDVCVFIWLHSFVLFVTIITPCTVPVGNYYAQNDISGTTKITLSCFPVTAVEGILSWPTRKLPRLDVLILELLAVELINVVGRLVCLSTLISPLVVSLEPSW